MGFWDEPIDSPKTISKLTILVSILKNCSLFESRQQSSREGIA